MFFKKKALNWWQQHKQKIGALTLVAPTYAKFKILLQDSLSKTQVFVDNIEKQFRNTSQHS